eukprot:COSAG06_NODE_1962_length_7974_cov_4.871111_2_plen_107_part_00
MKVETEDCNESLLPYNCKPHLGHRCCHRSACSETQAIHSARYKPAQSKDQIASIRHRRKDATGAEIKLLLERVLVTISQELPCLPLQCRILNAILGLDLKQDPSCW